MVLGADAGDGIDQVFSGVVADLRLSRGQSGGEYLRAVYENGRAGATMLEIGLPEARPDSRRP